MTSLLEQLGLWPRITNYDTCVINFQISFAFQAPFIDISPAGVIDCRL